MNKRDLLGDTVLRRSAEGQLYLMNRQEGGWGARAIPIESEGWLVAHYNVRVGEWGSDEHGECCPVIRVAPVVFGAGGSLTLGSGDKEAFAIKVRLDSGPFPEGTLVPVMVDGSMVQEKSLSEIRELSRAQALGKAIYEDGALEDQCLQREGLTEGVKGFIDSHPGARVCQSSEGVYVALLPDGTVFAVDKDGTAIAEEDLPKTD